MNPVMIMTMSPAMLLVAILLPILGGIILMALPFRKRRHMEIYLETIVIITSVLVWLILIGRASCRERV